MSFEDYCKAPGINGSMIAAVDMHNLEVAKAQLDGKREVTSDALDFGKAFHALITEGKREYAVQPDTYKSDEGEKPWNNNAKVCKAWYAEQVGREVLTKKEESSLNGMSEKIRSHKVLSGMLEGAESELSIFVEKDGIAFKARIDTLPKKGPVIDWKSTRDAKPEKFIRSSLDLRYHLRAAFYLDVLAWAGDRRESLWFAGIEKEAPYTLGIAKFNDQPESFLRVGRIKSRAIIRQIINAQQTGIWSDYGTYEAEEYAPSWTIAELQTT